MTGVREIVLLAAVIADASSFKVRVCTPDRQILRTPTPQCHPKETLNQVYVLRVLCE
jgi:hypothetical protein